MSTARDLPPEIAARFMACLEEVTVTTVLRTAERLWNSSLSTAMRSLSSANS